MGEYHKIQTVWLRDPATNHKTLLEGQWAKPSFEYLKDCDWVWTEKVDGTNIRVMWDGQTVRFGGKTDNAQIPAFLLARLQDLFTVETIADKFPPPNNNTVTLYGEGYGARIQKGGGNYIPDGVDFILFDARIGDWWLARESVAEIAAHFKIGVVPEVGRGPLIEAISMAHEGFHSIIGLNHGRDFPAEGLVMRPAVELADRDGSRVIAKIKCKDFA